MDTQDNLHTIYKLSSTGYQENGQARGQFQKLLNYLLKLIHMILKAMFFVYEILLDVRVAKS